MTSSLIGSIINPYKRSANLANPVAVTSLDAKSTVSLIKVDGPGLFLTADITKTGGATPDSTKHNLVFVTLIIDGMPVLGGHSFKSLYARGLTAANAMGVAAIAGANNTHTMLLGLPYPITFQNSLIIQATVQEPGIASLYVNVLTAG